MKKGKRNYYLFIDVFRIFGKDIFEDDEEEEVKPVQLATTTPSAAARKVASPQQQEKPAPKPKSLQRRAKN